jgi:outer membrane protein
MLAASFLALAGPAAAATLYDSIVMAYETNPSLRAQRADLRALDEGLVQARAGYGPQVNLTAQGAYTASRVQAGASLFGGATDTSYRAANGSGDLSIVQPLYTSGAVRAQIGGAGADILAGREGLRQAESQLIIDVITAYLDVRRDRETIRILKDEIVNLTREFAETKAKGELGQLTRTDVAESEARLLSAQAQLNLAEGRLRASNAEYLKTVGENPADLDPEPELPGLPATIDQAFDAADRNNPQLLQAIETERGARARVDQAKAALGPTVSIRVDAAAAPIEPYLPSLYSRSLTGAVVVNQPIFTSGLDSSKVREAADRDGQAMLNIEVARRGVVQLVAQAWAQLKSTQGAAAIEARQVEVERVAVEGNEVEERAGLRTTIELLNAELELADSRVNLVQSRHDEYLAQATLLSAMGLLETRLLVPSAQTYDPRTALKHVETLYAPPWEGAVGALDSLGAATTPPPSGSTTGAGAARPTDVDIPLPPGLEIDPDPAPLSPPSKPRS